MADRLLCASYIIPSSNGTEAYRVVLVERNYDIDGTKNSKKGDIHEYVVWIETMQDDNVNEHAGYHSGLYYPVAYDQSNKKEQFLKALHRFKERCVIML